MNTCTAAVIVGSLPLLVATSPALADFSGQTILGPLSVGSSVTGDLTGASDDNDGFTSGMHFFDVWLGGDDVYGLDWLGGSISLTLTSFGGSDADLFLYTPDNLDDSGFYSIRGPLDTVLLPNAPAGFYYIVIDTTEFGEGEYQLDVELAIPAPGVAAMLGLAFVTGRRRRRGM